MSSSAKDQGHKPHQNTVIVNGRSVTVTDKELTYEQVVAFSELPASPEASFIVTYSRGQGNKPTGSMVNGGDPVKVKDGMVFNVEPTNRS